MKIKSTILIFCVVVFLFFLNAPVDFPVNSIFQVEEGDSLRSVSLKLKQNHIIRSRIFFEAFIIIFGREKHVISSGYSFESKLPVYEVARRIGSGKRNTAPVLVTIPEGFDRAQIADAFVAKLANFNKNNFLLKTKDLEGYLFPDTYFFLTTDGEEEVIKSMRTNFEKKIALLEPEIARSSKTEKEIIIMASIIEREAKGDTDRGFISGILWKRIKLGIALQADAVPETYKTRGLPVGPVANPGLEAVKAALYPQDSPYLYYLHDSAGGIHYAKSFTEHQINIKKYLSR